MGTIKATVFDLDDTLYLEQDYVASGFRAVAAHLSSRSSLRDTEIFAWLWNQFQTGVRGNSFDLLLQEFPKLSSIAPAQDLVDLYRTHAPRLELLEGMGNLLDKIVATRSETAIITDGNTVSQAAKMQALGLHSRIRRTVQTAEWGAQFCKPHPRAYETFATLTGIPASQCVYIGDNPEKDFQGARRLGWKTVRLRLPGQLHYAMDATTGFGADFEVGSVASLADFLLSSLNTN